MSLQTVLASIEADGAAAIDRLKANSDQRVQSILAEADAQAEKVTQDALYKAETEAQAERTRILQHAQHEALTVRQQAYNRITAAALETIQAQLEHVRQRTDYADVLAALIDEAYELLLPSLKPDEVPYLEADVRDKTVIMTVLTQQQHTLTDVRYVLTCAGGVNLKNAAGDIAVYNTLENRFEQAQAAIRRHIAHQLEQENLAKVAL